MTTTTGFMGLGHGDTTGRFFTDATYHHAVLRALNHVAARGADVSEVLQATTRIRASDAQGWYREWAALAERNEARGRAARNVQSRGEALLRAHTYLARAQFYLPPQDPRRPAAFDRCRALFYEGLETLGIAHERIAVPYGAHRLPAVYYPAPRPVPGPLIVFHGGYDTIVEELYFFLAASAVSRGYSVLTFDGPGQGAPLREAGLQFTPEWEKPTSAVLDAFLATHEKPASIVLIGLGMGGYLAPRAAAFEPRIDGVVSYDICYDLGAAFAAGGPRFATALARLGLGLVDAASALVARFRPGVEWGIANASWTLGSVGFTGMLAAARPYTLEGVAHRITKDVMILAGEDDQFIPCSQVRTNGRWSTL